MKSLTELYRIGLGPSSSHTMGPRFAALAFKQALDALPVPNSRLIVGTLAKHNAPPRGSIAFIDQVQGKNNPKAITNLEHPDAPTYDMGESCDPWPLSEDVVLFSGRPPGAKRNVIEMMDRSGHRFTLVDDPEICLHSPMLIKPRPVPPVIPNSIQHTPSIVSSTPSDMTRLGRNWPNSRRNRKRSIRRPRIAMPATARSPDSA